MAREEKRGERAAPTNPRANKFREALRYLERTLNQYSPGNSWTVSIRFGPERFIYPSFPGSIVANREEEIIHHCEEKEEVFVSLLFLFDEEDFFFLLRRNGEESKRVG